MRVGHTAEAIGFHEKSLELNPDDPSAVETLAELRRGA